MIKLFLLSLFLLLNSCSDLEPELTRKTAAIKISHNVLKSNNRLTRATTFQQEFFPVYHLIAVEPDVDILLLDNDMTAEVLVPIDTPLWVNYINWTEEQPNIHYQYGVSEEFVVTKDTPKRIKAPSISKNLVRCIIASWFKVNITKRKTK